MFSFSNSLQISVNCEFDEWEEWTQCTATCNGGTRFRTRGIKVAAAYGGAECDGDVKEEETCNNQPCPGTSKSQLRINASYCYITMYSFLYSSYFYSSMSMGGLGRMGYM